MRSKYKSLYLTVIIVLALIFSPVYLGKAQSGKNIKGKIVFIKGLVTVNGKKARVGGTLKYGDVIKTDKNGVCRFKIGKKNIFQLKKLSVLEFKVNRKTGAIKLKKGWMAGVIKAKALFENGVQIQTVPVVAGVRGTSFCMKVENPKSVYFCTCNGTINLEDKDGKEARDVTGIHHNAHRYKVNSDDTVSYEKAGMKYHGDKVIDALAAEIKVEVDWSKASD